ncbi:MAG TPA: hypothetical protein VM778_09860, partial [Gemmatimonadota bacterium]|nr:hypothetical protein [Gemmatimonadota bacterium]
MQSAALVDSTGMLPVAGVPRGALPSLSELFLGGAPHPVALGLATAGDVLWLVAYILFIRAGFRDRTYGVPLLAVCLNFTWELWFAVLHPPAGVAARVTHGGWFLLDALIVWQVIRYGRNEQTIPEIRRWFYAVLVGTMLLCLVGQVTLHSQVVSTSLFPDPEGYVVAWVINLVMSALFVFMFFHRRDLRGLSYGGAWSMLVGTGLVAIGNLLVFARELHRDFEFQARPLGAAEWSVSGMVGTDTVERGFFIFLYGTIFLFNAIYV